MADQVTPVVLRRWRDTGDVIALFPTLPAEAHSPGLVTSYEHVGQHGAADYGTVLKQTRPVKHHELDNFPKGATDVADLIAELLAIGYTNLKPYRRWSPRYQQ